TDEPAQARPDIDEKEGRHRPQPAGVREELEDHPPVQPVPEPPRIVLLDVRARLLDQDVVADTGRAGGDARHASQAAIEVRRHRPGHLQLSGAQPAHQIDAPAGRVHLLAPVLVRRAGRQAEPAMHAVVDQLPLRRGHTMNLPGASRFPGSNCFFTDRCTASDAGGGPQSPGAVSHPPTVVSARRADCSAAGSRPAENPHPTPTVGSQQSRARSGARAFATSAAWVGRAAKRIGTAPEGAAGHSHSSRSRSFSRCARTPAENPSNRRYTSHPAPSPTASIAAGSSCCDLTRRTSSTGSAPRARSESVCSGSGWTRKVAVAMNASVPYEPHISLGRSNPATVFTTFPPPFARVPAARTTEIPMIRSRTLPYRVRSGPNEFAATIPPMVAFSGCGGSSASRWPFFPSSP